MQMVGASTCLQGHGSQQPTGHTLHVLLLHMLRLMPCTHLGATRRRKCSTTLVRGGRLLLLLRPLLPGGVEPLL
jgi:hypothetical protein